MKKKAGTFFKNVLSKGKNLFKKEEQQNEESKGEVDYGTEEDNDIIEVGKLSKLPQQLLNNLSDFTGSTLSAADSFIHGSNISNQSMNGKEMKNDLQQLCKVLSTQGGTEEDESPSECNNQSNNWFFQDYTDINIDILRNKSSITTEEERQASQDLLNQPMKLIEFIVIVGFHHKVGSQVEYVYPPLSEDKEECLTSEFLKQIPLFALPDGSHLTEGGYVNFMLKDKKNLFHCISCYRQISSRELPQEDSISRAYVQKAVVILTKIPLYGELRAKLQPTTQALFNQKNFKDTQILQDLYIHANNFNKGLVKDYSQFYTGLNLKTMILLPNFNILTLLKLILLEGRIVIYSSISSKVSNFVYSLLAFFPGNISFKYAKSEQVIIYLRSQKSYGFPLQIFSQTCPFIPLCTLQELDQLEKVKGYLLGTTNMLLLNYPKGKADLIINLDTEKIEFPNEKSNLVKICKQHTSYEKKMISKLLSQIEIDHNDNVESEQNKIGPNGMMKEQDKLETQGLMMVNETEQNQIRQEFKSYFQLLVAQLSLVKQIEDEFVIASSPQWQKAEQSQSESEGDSDKNEEKSIMLQTIKIEDSYQEDSLSSINEQIKSIQQEIKSPEKIHSQAQSKSEKKQKSSSKSKEKKNNQVEKFNDKIKKVKEIDKSNAKKMIKLKKKAIKSILSYQGIFNIKFLVAWSKTYNFKQWLKTVDYRISALSPQSGFTNSITIYYENGDYYQGNLMNGIRNGVGTYYDASIGLNYNGEWWDDQKHGTGNLSSQNQDYIYDGQWEMGMKHGQGQLITKDVKYSGGWMKDKYHKFGVQVSNDGTVYEGDWFQGKKQGMGQLKMSNGDIYIGEFYNDEFHGQGQLRYSLDNKQGELYNGQFEHGKRHGTGQYISGDQKLMYEGQWFSDIKYGQGTLILINDEQQKEIVGEWEKDNIVIDKETQLTIKQNGIVVTSCTCKIDKDYNQVQ